MSIKKIGFSTFFLLTITLFSVVSNAGVLVGGTRVIYDGGKKESSLSVSNPQNSIPYLIQTWIDGDGPDGTVKTGIKAPFIVTPPLFLLNSGSQNVLRIVRTGGSLPDDRESVFWLNIKSIPSRASNDSGKNMLQISIKTRIKLFYRPHELSKMPDNAYSSLVFTRLKNSLIVKNPTPYYMTFSSLSIGGHSIKIGTQMVPPKGTASYPLSTDSTGKIHWRLINDYGGLTPEMAAEVQ